MTTKNVIEAKELPEGLFRAFSRVDTVKEQPLGIYSKHDVSEEDYATFEFKPADVVTAEEIRSIVMTLSAINQQCAENNGIAMTDLVGGELNKASKAKKAKILQAYQDMQMATNYELSTASTRETLAKCMVSVTNYKTIKGGALVDSGLTPKEVALDMPAMYCEWALSIIQDLSNLTHAEVLGV